MLSLIILFLLRRTTLRTKWWNIIQPLKADIIQISITVISVIKMHTKYIEKDWKSIRRNAISLP